jgi:hypothetical protein
MHANTVLMTRLGYAGIVPFVTLTALLWLVRDPQPAAWLSIALAGYAACVASFFWLSSNATSPGA